MGVIKEVTRLSHITGTQPGQGEVLRCDDPKPCANGATVQPAPAEVREFSNFSASRCVHGPSCPSWHKAGVTPAVSDGKTRCNQSLMGPHCWGDSAVRFYPALQHPQSFAEERAEEN